MPCSLTNLTEDRGDNLKDKYDNIPYSKFQQINKDDVRFQNILSFIDGNYYVSSQDKELLVNCILDIKQNNSFLESLPFDYYLLVVKEDIVCNNGNPIDPQTYIKTTYSYLVLVTHTGLMETPVYKDFTLTNEIQIDGDINEFKVVIYKNIITTYGYTDNIFYIDMCYMLFSNNIIIEDYIEHVELDIVCDDVKKLTDYLSNRKNKYSILTMFPQQDNKISLYVQFKNENNKSSNKEFNFIFKHNHSKYLQMELI